jgi:hypothetical protein
MFCDLSILEAAGCRCSKPYQSGGSAVSALAISSCPAPVAELFASVPVADPAAPAPVAEVFVPLPVADPAAPAPVAEVFVPLPVADPAASAPVAAAFVPLPVADPAVFVPLAAIFVPVPVSALVPAVLVSAAQVPLAVSCSSHFPSCTNELSKFRTGAQTVLHAQPSSPNSLILLSTHFVPGNIFAAQRVDRQYVFRIHQDTCLIRSIIPQCNSIEHETWLM